MIIFGSVRFLFIKTNQTDFFLKKLKPSQTDRFRFGSVFNIKKPRKPIFFGAVFNGFLMGFLIGF